MKPTRLSQRRHAARGSGYYYPLLVGTAVIAWLFAVIFVSGRASLAFASLAALAMTVLIHHGIAALLPQLLVPSLIPLSFSLQLLPLVLLSGLGLRTVSNNEFAVDIADFPFTVTFALLLVPVASLAAALAARLFGKQGPAAPQMKADEALHLYLGFAAVVMLLYWPASSEAFSRSGYFIRVMAHSLVLVPVLAGRHLIAPSFTRQLWWGSLTANAFIGLLVGSRAVALMPPGLFLIGHISALSGDQRKRAIWFALAAAVPTLVTSGLIGHVRDSVGRGGIELLSTERLDEVFNQSSAFLRESGHDETLGQDLAFQGVGRLFAWANAVVPIVSPKMVPYRGLDGIHEEIEAYAQIGQRSRADMYDANLSTAPATLYGFTVDTGTSVEFGIIPDGWSRGGPGVVFLFGFAFTLLLIVLEQGIRAISFQTPAVSAMLLAIIARVVNDINVNPLLEVIRMAVLNVTFFLLLLGAVELVRSAMRVPVRAQ